MMCALIPYVIGEAIGMAIAIVTVGWDTVPFVFAGVTTIPAAMLLDRLIVRRFL